MMDFLSVIIPAHNAERTIGGTLASALAQVDVRFEVIVVDDGSTDSTADLVTQAMRQDNRVRLIQQQNGGVARARNLAITHAQGNFIAPLDADDLWHREKLTRQLALLNASGPEVALVYNWFRRITEDDLVIPGSPRPQMEGWVFHRHLAWNFISNGSTPLIRRSVLDDFRYDPQLRDRGLQGCEDYLLQLQIAQKYRFACVPGFLTGYRRSPGAMSTHVERMIRSHIAMFDIIGSQADAAANGVIQRQRARLFVELARNHMRKLDWRGVARSVKRALSNDIIGTAHSLKSELVRGFGRRTPFTSASGQNFASLGAEDIDGSWIAQRSRGTLDYLADMDHRRPGSGIGDDTATDAAV